jgi:copper transport protein
VVALAATGALAGYPPSVAASSGPYSTTATMGPARLELTVDPARTGPNEMHLYLINRADGRQFTATKELTVTAQMHGKIAPIKLDATRAGPGHYLVSGATFGVKGDWHLEVVARVSEFDELRKTLVIPIR